MKILNFLTGTVFFTVAEKNRGAFLNLCHEYSIPILSSFEKKGKTCFVCRNSKAALLEKRAADQQIEFFSEHHGLPRLIRRIGARPGLVAGAVLGTLLLFLSGQMIWNIEVNATGSAEEMRILDYLAEVGLYVGAPIPSGSFDDEEMNLMQAHEEIGWISLSMKGTTLTARVRDSYAIEAPGASVGNLVADGDGIIERIRVTKGQIAVAVGDVVRKGDILVSGIYQSRNGQIRTGEAVGEVFAKRVYTICVEIPFEKLEKQYTGQVIREKWVKFFANNIKLSPNSRNVPSTCDIIYYENLLHFEEGKSVPIGLLIREYRPYEYVTVQRTHAEAMDKAWADLEAQLYSLSDRVELREKNITGEWTETSYILTCQLVCVEDIAVFEPMEEN